MEPVEPTDEQATAVELFGSGVSLAIQAGAGCGKTTALRMLAEATDRQGQYIAFNKAVVGDAKQRMPRSIACSTAHSLAFRTEGRQMSHRLNSGRVRSHDIAKRLGITAPLWLDLEGGQRKGLQPGYLASTVMRAMTAFAFTADPAPGPRHVPYVEGIDAPDTNGRRAHVNNDALAHHLAPFLTAAWADLQNPEGALPYRHDFYLKSYELHEPRIAGDFILADECQDLSEVMISILEQQQGTQLVAVGDSQQQLYAWRGAVDALELLPTEARAYLSQSFRFGPAIADVANMILAILGAELRITGTPTIDSRIDVVDDPDAILTRSNAGAVTNVMRLQREGRVVHLVGGGSEVAAFGRAAGDVKTGRGTAHHDLACFDTWLEVQAYVEDDPMGSELRLLVGLVDEFGVDAILRAMENMPLEEDADVIVSTAHKSKGREWPLVQLADDFGLSADDPGELRLLYVAATRARHVLDVTRCDPLYELLYGPRQPAVELPACAEVG